MASVLVGMRSAAEVADAAAMFVRGVPARMWEELRAEGLLGAGVPVPAEAGRS